MVLWGQRLELLAADKGAENAAGSEELSALMHRIAQNSDSMHEQTKALGKDMSFFKLEK